MVRRMRFRPVAALRTGGVVHHVRGDEIVERGVVTRLLPSEHLLDDLLRTALAHEANLHQSCYPEMPCCACDAEG